MTDQIIDECLKKFPNVNSLKDEQKSAVQNLLEGRDVFAVLPTGFGKSLIYQFYVMAKLLAKSKCCVLVVSPLKSIIQDQISDLEEVGIAAVEIDKGFLKSEADHGRFKVLFSSAENRLSKGFQQLLKRGKVDLSLIVVDESHTVESWGTSKKIRKKTQPAFRKDYGNLACLRSFTQQDTPLLALTGTASKKIGNKIKKLLAMKSNTLVLTVCPDRPNIRYSVHSVKKGEEMDKLKWITEMAKTTGSALPKTIIFCNTYNEIAAVLAFLLRVLDDAAYVPGQPKCPSNCIIAIYHSLTWTLGIISLGIISSSVLQI